ncbi:MAG: hypothetical protein Q9182_005725 [Xanthomendoza sp. 2 TL-2023]
MDSLPVAHLLTIDAGRLKNGDPEEATKLFRAAKEDGVFYLDFQHSSDANVLSDVDGLFAFAEELFNLSEEEKLQYDIDNLGELKLNGYKPVGRNHGGIGGASDGFESFAIPGKRSLDPSLVQLPLLANKFTTLTGIFTHIRQILLLLLRSLSASLNLPADADLSNFHRVDVSSPDVFRLLHYTEQPTGETGIPQAAHTDLGSLTMLFARSPGLQIHNPRNKQWEYILPKSGCAIINVGDGLTMLTGGSLRSCLHRVSPREGQAMQDRYSIAYLLRAEDDAVMKPLPGLGGAKGSRRADVYSSREWLMKKFGMIRKGPIEAQ